LSCSFLLERLLNRGCCLVEIRGVSKRQKKPIVLNVDQFHRLLAELKNPYRMMVILAMCSGFRASEIAGLVWESIDWQNGVLYARQGAVHGRIGRLKTEVSDDEVPMEESFAKALRRWGAGKPMSGLVFPSSTGGPPHMGTVRQGHIRPAARRAGVELRGWHTFRHTYRAILGDTDARIGVQQKLMRHAQISNHEYIWKRLHLCEKEGELQGCRNGSAPVNGAGFRSSKTLNVGECGSNQLKL
jgi:integrase